MKNIISIIILIVGYFTVPTEKFWTCIGIGFIFAIIATVILVKKVFFTNEE